MGFIPKRTDRIGVRLSPEDAINFGHQVIGQARIAMRQRRSTA